MVPLVEPDYRRPFGDILIGGAEFGDVPFELDVAEAGGIHQDDGHAIAERPESNGSSV